ncbi:V-type ATPase subunit [Aerococcus kribbianus]|uniref:V-type ATPase subunit n=1 Tax=Aerococcus kribbianus TaxID=2999064 RepID=A0A9X3FQV2_9LACT|nr:MULTISPECIES: V-type ATPase subunit [unclassified Aerococcus]MCZ0717917.1 V-type ATPase subunit [Aerococcus sp. YH-aer221]MCZ0726204.1 V-type ATPase subunit [Aerococcus sp. YH-aer222]
MQDVAYGAINTTVRVRETTFLTKADYEAMLRADSLADAIAVLRKTDYHVPDDILESKDFEAFLNQSLKANYRELYAGVPDAEVIDILALRYDYHNLKVLFKAWYADKEFDDMLLDFGHYSVDSLRHAIKTDEGRDMDSVMHKAISDVKTYYEDYEDLNGISILLDNAYLNHIGSIKERIDSPEVETYIEAIIDLENLSTIIRAMKQGRSQGFLKVITSDQGTVKQEELLPLADRHDFDGIISLYAHQAYGDALEDYVGQGDAVDVVALDATIAEIKAQMMKNANLAAFGPLPSLAYLYFKENEISNIRLILTAKDYGLPKEKIEERMRPIYGL